VPNGIGATVKRIENRIVTQDKDIMNVDTFVMILQNSISNIQIRVIESSAIEAMMSLVPSYLKPLNGTMKVHQIAWKECKSKLHINKLSGFLRSYHCKYYKTGTDQQSNTPKNFPKMVKKEKKKKMERLTNEL